MVGVDLIVVLLTVLWWLLWFTCCWLLIGLFSGVALFLSLAISCLCLVWFCLGVGLGG